MKLRKLVYYVLVAIVWGLVAFAVYLTSEKAETELLYKRAFSGLPDGMIVCEYSQHGMRVVLVNPAAEALLGFTEQELQEKGVGVLMSSAEATVCHTKAATEAANNLLHSANGWTEPKQRIMPVKLKGHDQPVLCALTVRGVSAKNRVHFLMTIQPLEKTFRDPEGREFKLKAD